MYCRNCGNQVSDKAIMCVACGTPPMAGDKHCYNCNAETNTNTTICMKCGVALQPPPTAQQQKPVAEGKDHLVTMMLCLLLGYLGMHRFYTKHTAIGVIQLLTLGGCGIWTLIDFIQIVSDNFKDADGNKLVHKN